MFIGNVVKKKADDFLDQRSLDVILTFYTLVLMLLIPFKFFQ